MQKIRFDLGEDRHVRLLVHATNDEPFAVRSASWKLCYGGTEEASGQCMIDGHVIDVKISPEIRTTYYLIITYQVADETLIEKIEVEVT